MTEHGGGRSFACGRLQVTAQMVQVPLFGELAGLVVRVAHPPQLAFTAMNCWSYRSGQGSRWATSVRSGHGMRLDRGMDCAARSCGSHTRPASLLSFRGPGASSDRTDEAPLGSAGGSAGPPGNGRSGAAAQCPHPATQLASQQGAQGHAVRVPDLRGDLVNAVSAGAQKMHGALDAQVLEVG